jgi:ribose-phosphate pyrophosphokinase
MPSNQKIYGEILLYAGNSTPELAQEVSQYLNSPLGGRDLFAFKNENIFCKLHSSARGQDVYVIQSTAAPVHENLMELLIMLQTLKLDSVGRLTAVIPYLCYARSDKKDQPRVPITARLIADMIQVAGADRYITMDLHAGQIQGFFSVPGDSISTFQLLSDYLEKKLPSMQNPVVVATDLGFAKKGRNFAERLNVPLAFVEKRRISNRDHAEAMSLIGDVRGCDVIIMDDEVDTGGSICEAVQVARKHGARNVIICFIHAVLSSPAAERLRAADVQEIVTTNTIPIPASKRLPNMTILSVAPLLGEVIKRAHAGRSVGALFHE